MSEMVGLLGIEPRSYAPHAQIIPLYDSPIGNYFFPKALIHLAQAKTLFPANSLYFFLVVSTGIATHCKLGYILFLGEGLYLEINFLYCLPIDDVFPHIVHSFSICIV